MSQDPTMHSSLGDRVRFHLKIYIHIYVTLKSWAQVIPSPSASQVAWTTGAPPPPDIHTDFKVTVSCNDAIAL